MNLEDDSKPDPGSPCSPHEWVPGEVHLRKTGATVTLRCSRCGAVSYDYGNDIQRGPKPTRSANDADGPPTSATS